jgi:hypothetical protein
MDATKELIPPNVKEAIIFIKVNVLLDYFSES